MKSKCANAFSFACFSIQGIIVIKVAIGFVVEQSYFYNDDMFNYNYGQAKAAVGNFSEAQEVRMLYWDYFWLYFPALFIALRKY